MKKSQNQTIKKLTKLFLLLVLLACQVACFPRPDPRWKQIPEAKQVTPEIRAKVCQYVTQRTQELKSLRELSELRMNTSEGLQSLRLSLVFQTPNQLRFEILPPAAALALYIASTNGTEALLLEPTKKKATQIEDPQDLMTKLLKVRIPPQDFAYILSARIPPRYLNRICTPVTQENDSKAVEFFYSTDGPGVTIFDPETGQYWTVLMSSGLLRTALLRRVSDSWPVLAADFEEDDFSDPSQLYPRKIDLVFGNELLFATLEPSIVKFNTAIPQTLFDLKVPAGYKVEQK